MPVVATTAGSITEVVDDGVEHDLYETPFTIDEESDEFRAPFYLIANLAIGGAFTDAYNLGNPGSGEPVSWEAPVPPSWPAMVMKSAYALATPAAIVPTPISATSFTLTRADGLAFFRS